VVAIGTSGAADLQHGQRTTQPAGAVGQRVTVGREHRQERLAHLGELVDPSVELGHLGLGALVQLAGAAPVLREVEQFLDLGQGDPSRCTALMVRSSLTASSEYCRCPEGRRVGAASRPRRS